MANHPIRRREDRLGWQLRREAFADQPPFSPTLHSRIIRALDQHERLELVAVSPPGATRGSKYLLSIGLVVAATLLLALAMRLDLPNDEHAVVGTSEQLQPLSAAELAAPLESAANQLAGMAKSASDDLVDSVVSSHWNYLDEHADEITTFLLDPLPIDIRPTALD